MKWYRCAVALIVGVSFLTCSSPDMGSIEPVPGSIAVYGDSRTQHDIHREIVQAMCEIEPMAVFHTGDLVEDGWDPGQWEIFNGIIAPLLETAVFYPALGNHEANSPYYFDNFNLPGNERWYVVDLGGAHFIVLDSNYPLEIGSDQYRWLKNDLMMADSDFFLVVVFHHPPFSSGSHAEDEMDLRRSIVPLFEEYGVDIVFNGHDHFYERSVVNSVVYVVTGGGGAPLHDRDRENIYSRVFFKEYHFCRLDIVDQQLNVAVYTRNLSRIDCFTVTK